MSVSKKGRILPKRGRVFPDGEYALAVRNALRENLGQTHRAVKTVARWTGASERTVKNWFASNGGPSGEHLIALMHNSDEVLSAVLRLAGRERDLLGMRTADQCKKLMEALEALRRSLE